MAQLCCVLCEDNADDNVMGFSHVTGEVKEKLRVLPKCSSVEHWSKTCKGVLHNYEPPNISSFWERQGISYGINAGFQVV